MKLRRGAPADIPALDRIALAAKAHWGYSPEQLRAWRSELLVAAESLVSRPICVAEKNGQAIGFVQLATDTRPWEIWALWVHPTHMRQGVGKALLAWASHLAAASGQSELAIDADPNAQVFYLACGARVVANVAAPVAGDAMRVRPQMRLRIPPAVSPRLGSASVGTNDRR